MIKFEFKNKKTGKKETYEKECITLGEAETFYDLREKIDKEYEKARVKAKNEVEKEHGNAAEFINSDLYDQLIQQHFTQNVEGRKIRKMERDYFVGLFEDQGLSEDDVLSNMSTKVYNQITKEIFREISGEDEESNQDESEELGKNGEQSQ